MRLPLLSAAAPALAALLLAACSRSSSASAPAHASAASSSNPAPAATAATASFTFPTQTLTVPAGFTVELVAGPPLVNRPISIAFDDAGRLYATDSSGLSDKADKQLEQKPHRIVRLEDADGDGRFDKSVVFAEHMMFPQGAMFHAGSLYVAAPPELWKLTDTNGDGVADERVPWHDGKTLTGCANDLHGPYAGPDGWIYWTKGAFAEQRTTLPNGKTLVSRAAHIFRARPDGSGLEPVLTGGMDNPVGVTFSLTGDRILSGTFFQIGTAGKRDGLIHAIYGGVYGKVNPATDGHVRTGDLMPIMTHMGAAAPCGSATYRSNVFGADYAGNLFVCYFNLRKISRHELVPDGATFTTKDTDFVTSNSHDFHPTDVLEDADGSLLFVDTGGWYKICCPTSQLAKPDVLGGIYRIRKVGAAAPADPRGAKLAWSSLQPADLVKLLADRRPDVVRRATNQLGTQGEAAVAPLATAAKAAAVATRRNALWALARIAAPAARTAVRSALHDPEPSVVQVALHLVSLSRDAAALERLSQLVAGDQPAVVRLAAEALGRIGDPRAVGAIFTAAARLGETSFTASGTPEAGAERILEHALTYALIEIGRPDEIRAFLKPSRSPRVNRIALVALSQIEGGLRADEVIPWLDSSVPRLKQTAAWTVGFHPEWGDALASFFRARLEKPLRGEADLAALQTQLSQLARAAAIQEMLAGTSRGGTSVDAQLVALRAMAGAGLKETPASWLEALAAVLSHASELTVVRQSLVTARAMTLPKSGHPALSAALARTGRNAALPADVCVEALALTPPAALGQVEPALFDFLTARLAPKESMLVRGAAATVLARASLTPAQRLTLADTMKTIGALEAPKLLPAFEKGATEELGHKLVAALRQSPAQASLRASVMKALFAKYPRSVQREAEAWFAQLNADAARQNAHVEELLTSLQGGDIRRGQAVFNSEKTACSLCHTIGYLGGRLGPDLTTIGRIRNERELLEAIVFPSATLVRGYETYNLTTKTGDAFMGIMKKDAPDEVVLATGPQTEQRFARSDIAELQPGTLSPMPPGLEAVLSKQDLADLVAFLKSRQ